MLESIKPVGQGRYLDLGCGNKKKDGYTGIDIDNYGAADIVQDLRFTPIPYKDNSIDGVYASHFLEHLTFDENIYLFNEIYRVLKPDAIFEIVVPHGFSYAGMVDLSHKTFWTEDTFGYFTPENKYYYSWFYTDKEGNRVPVINKWAVLDNDSTPPMEYDIRGWINLKLREVHAHLRKLV